MAKIVSHRSEHDQKLKKATKTALRLVGGLAQRKAKETITEMGAVDTGNLRNSITHAMEGDNAVHIGTNVFYAPYVEFGTRHMVARPFLSESIQSNKDEFRNLIEESFQQFMD